MLALNTDKETGRPSVTDAAEPPGAQSILKRVSVKPAVDREIWAKAAGRCVLCASYLLSASWDFDTYSVGQVAHIIGATDAPGSPRGQSPLSDTERAAASNLMLLCHPCHRKADGDTKHYTEEYLLSLKDQFEQRVREVTNFASLEPTVVVRLASPIRGHAAVITDGQVSEALRESRLTYAGEDVRAATERINLNTGEAVTGVWSTGSSHIETKVERAIQRVEDTSAESLSVFALAPIPFLVKLGHEIGTKHTVHVFERHRADNRGLYQWPTDPANDAEFSISSSVPDSAETDVVALVSVTAPVQINRAPSSLHHRPTVAVALAGAPRAGAIASAATLERFAKAWRDALQLAEEKFPLIERLHILAATPIAASIELGRHRMRDVHPQFVVYQLNALQQYEKALTVG
jgi:hypothetical protein